jgi:hypothetical protein
VSSWQLALFVCAGKKVMQSRCRHLSGGEMLEHLKWLLNRGKLTAKVINEDKNDTRCLHVLASLQELNARLQSDRIQAEQELQRNRPDDHEE